jgi:hypothetical protein
VIRLVMVMVLVAAMADLICVVITAVVTGIACGKINVMVLVGKAEVSLASVAVVHHLWQGSSKRPVALMKL